MGATRASHGLAREGATPEYERAKARAMRPAIQRFN